MIDNCQKLIYITNGNFWNSYYVYDFKKRQRLQSGKFDSKGTRLFGVFGCTTFEDLLITTGSSYAINEKDFAHCRVSKIRKDYSLEAKAIKLCDLGNMYAHNT